MVCAEAGREVGSVPVLIIDDNVDFAENLKEVLEDEGIEAEIASCAADALRILEEVRPKVIVTDQRMPDMSGLGLCYAVRERWPGIPIVMITAYSLESVIREARITGVLSILSKPVDLAEFTSLIERVVAPSAQILVAEDQDELRADLLEALQDIDGVVPHGVRTVQEALELIGQVHFDAAVLDMRLPDGDGVEVGDLLQGEDNDDSVPLLYITGYADDVQTKLAGRDGTAEVIVKPFPPSRLLDALRRIICN